MNRIRKHNLPGVIACLLALILVCMALSACAKRDPVNVAEIMKEPESDDPAGFLRIAVTEPSTVDFHCTSGDYDIALNVFDRLVRVQVDEDGSSHIVPSLASSWEVSPDGLTWTFHLEDGVLFSNGSELTSEDVQYSFVRLLTHPDAVNQDIILDIVGADALQSGETDVLEGLEVLDDHSFRITLIQPNAAFLACLSTPGASILDRETTEEAGERFGTTVEWTIGTGAFILRDWTSHSGMVLDANRGCWSGPPRCDGIHMYFVSDPETQKLMYMNGELDILDLDNIGSEAEYIVYGDIYQNQLHQGPRVGISYIALNESVEPLDNVLVRKALTYALDRQALLDAAYGGRGLLENGIFPHGLVGFDPELPQIPYDPERARELLLNAEIPSFSLTLYVERSSTDSVKELMNLVAHMWQKIGVKAQVEELEDSDFMDLRRSGEMPCYTSTWSADFNDPDNFIYTFFGNEANTKQRSLNYPDTDVIRRVHEARSILDEEQRLAEYHALERQIVQEDAAWIPLFSKFHVFAVNERVHGFRVSWNGWSSNQYHEVGVD